MQEHALDNGERPLPVPHRSPGQGHQGARANGPSSGRTARCRRTTRTSSAWSGISTSTMATRPTHQGRLSHDPGYLDALLRLAGQGALRLAAFRRPDQAGQAGHGFTARALGAERLRGHSLPAAENAGPATIHLQPGRRLELPPVRRQPGAHRCAARSADDRHCGHGDGPEADASSNGSWPAASAICPITRSPRTCGSR